jgi:ABC-type uncharacterized transport system permease subunit
LTLFSQISTTCFTASYLVALVLEALRPMWSSKLRHVGAIGFLSAGVLAHLLYLVFVARGEMSSGQGVFANWYDWSLIASLVLVCATFGLVVRRPQNTVAVFLLPLVLALIGVAHLCRDMEPFQGQQAIAPWRLIHGAALLIGTVSVVLGFATGVMFLMQSSRLKNKRLPLSGLRLPSLEWLQRFNREALFLSAVMLGVGLVSGVVLAIRPGHEVSFTDPGIVSSSVLFAWILGACIFEVFYQPARQGRKVAYVTLANFVFLVLVLALLLYSGHAGKPPSSSFQKPPHPRPLSPRGGEGSQYDSRMSRVQRVPSTLGRVA